jgi:alcohol dehydrogenase class IV
VEDFVWQDGERIIRFGERAPEHAWEGSELLTTARAEATIPGEILGRFGSVLHVPAGQVPDIAAELEPQLTGPRLTAWGGGRVIDTAKALASARHWTVCAVPTTLSGAEMTTGHRTLGGAEHRPRCRPALVLAAPQLMASAPPPELRDSALNALGHAAEALHVPSRNPVATLAGVRAAVLLAAGLDDGQYESLALGSVLAGYALDATELSLHHVVCQTIVRTCGTGHAPTNAVMLPHTVTFIAETSPQPMAQLAEALGTDPAGLEGRLVQLGGPPRTLRDLGVGHDQLDAVAQAAAGRSELARLDPQPGRAQLLRLLERAW